MSGREGSTGYSFFSEGWLAGRPLELVVFGDEAESDGEDGEPLSGDEERGGELEPELKTDTDSLGPKMKLSEELFARRYSSKALLLGSLGGMTITSNGRRPVTSTAFGLAPASRRSLTASSALIDPPEAAQ